MTFQVNNTYAIKYIGDSQMEDHATVIKRTKCFATVVTKGGETHRAKIRTSIYDDGEFLLPYGDYSMAPVMRANRQIN